MKHIIITLIAVAVLLSACGGPAPTTPPPTDVPTAIPTEAPTNTIAPAPTITAIPSATPNPLLFRDDFEGALDAGWAWTRENKKSWSLTNNPGWLEIMARPGGVADTMENVLLRPAPEGNFEIEIKLNFRPVENFQIAGVVIYESAANFIQFGRAFCGFTPEPCVGDGFYIDNMAGGGMNPENFSTAAPAVDVVYLRFRREGSIYTAYASEDGTTWQVIGSHNNGMTPMFVGLVSGQAYQTVPKPAQFDYFLINSLP